MLTRCASQSVFSQHFTGQLNVDVVVVSRHSEVPPDRVDLSEDLGWLTRDWLYDFAARLGKSSQVHFDPSLVVKSEVP